MSRLRFRVLGPLLVAGPDGWVSPGGAKARAVLALLLLHANHAVPADQLMFEVWGEDADPGHVHKLQSHVTRIRTAAGGTIDWADGSYVLKARPDEVDAAWFEQLLRRAKGAPDPEGARRLCLEALELWRGVPYAELADREFLVSEVRRLVEVRLEVIEVCVRADLELGKHRSIIGSLRAAVGEFPYNETLWEFYLEALRSSGRTVEALQAYDELETLLDDELSIAPAPRLRQLRASLTATD